MSDKHRDGMQISRCTQCGYLAGVSHEHKGANSHE